MTINLQNTKFFKKNLLGGFQIVCSFVNTNKSTSMNNNQISLSSNQLKLSLRSFLVSGTMR